MTGFFYREIFFAGFFSVRNLKNEKKSGAKVGKKGVSLATDCYHRRKTFAGRQVMKYGNPHFFRS
jgi:hypothetical protein